MTSNHLPIIVTAFNRPNSLKRLLQSIANSNLPEEGVDLIISIDFSGKDDVENVAEAFEWRFGGKRIIRHKKNLGLKEHILKCGDLSSKYEGIIMIEDDLIVSPAFYKFATASFRFYQNVSGLAGISLYGCEYNEFAKLPFAPIEDDFDSYFAKVPSSWGQIFSRDQWRTFREYLSKNDKFDNTEYVHDSVFNWNSNTSWKKFYFRFMIERELYFVYPKKSFTSNLADHGVHFNTPTNLFRTSFSLKKENFNFPLIAETVNVYDQFWELEIDRVGSPFLDNCRWLENYEIDLNGSKPLGKVPKKFIITSRSMRNAVRSVTIDYYPWQLNLLISPIKSTAKLAFHAGLVAHVSPFGYRSVVEDILSRLPREVVEKVLIEGMEKVKLSKRYKLGDMLISGIQPKSKR